MKYLYLLPFFAIFIDYPQWLKDWGRRFWADFLEVLSGRPALELLHKVSAFFVGLYRGLNWHGFKALVAFGVEEINAGIVNFADVFTELAGNTIKQITGIGIDAKAVGELMNEPPGRKPAVDLGHAFLPVVDQIFDINAAIADAAVRNRYEGALDNIRAYFGTNLLFQLRSITIATLASFMPYFQLRHLEGLHQSINWAFGFGWLSWSVMSSVMDVTTTLKLKQHYLSKVKPMDYSEAEVRWAYWAGFASQEVYGQVMDNQGNRDDIRQPLLERAQADYTETDLVDLYQHGRLERADIQANFRLKGYGEKRATDKTERVVDTRLWDLLDKINTQYLTLYRDCVVEWNEVDVWLSGQGWSANERDAARALKELERRNRQWLSPTEVEKALEQGLMDSHDAFAQFTCQGMTEIDALVRLILLEIKALPKDCADKITPRDQAAAWTAIFASLGVGTLVHTNASLLKLFQCLGTIPFFVTPPEEKGPKPPAPKLPSGSFNALPSSPTRGEQFRLEWSIQNADTVDINEGIGRVQAQGTLFLTAAENTVWHLTAKNADGERTFQASILVKPAPSEKPPKPPAPRIELLVSDKTPIKGDQVSIQWSVTGADDVFFDDGSGPRAVAPIAGTVIVADDNKIITLTASGPGGQSSRGANIVVKFSPPKDIPDPVANIAVTPGQQDQGAEVEVRWTTKNADHVVLSGVPGLGVVGPVGVAIMQLQQDTIVILEAQNSRTGVVAQSMDAAIVKGAPGPETPTVPKPTASLTLRPSSPTQGDTVAVEWRTTNAQVVTLQGDGSSRAVDAVGATTITARATGIWVLRAGNAEQSVAVAKVLIVKPPKEKK